VYDIVVYPPDSYIVCDEEYGYGYFRLNFLEVAETLTDEEMYEIATRIAKVFENYMEEHQEANDE